MSAYEAKRNGYENANRHNRLVFSLHRQATQQRPTRQYMCQIKRIRDFAQKFANIRHFLTNKIIAHEKVVAKQCV